MPSGKQLLISIGTVVLIFVLIILAISKSFNSIKKEEEEREIMQKLVVTPTSIPTIMIETETLIASPTAILEITPTVPVKNKIATP